MLYRKKPVIVEAMLFTEETKDMVYSWARGIQMNIEPSTTSDGDPCLLVPTLEGEMTCCIGDYLIKEPFPTDWRKLYPCKPEAFKKTYEDHGDSESIYVVGNYSFGIKSSDDKEYAAWDVLGIFHDIEDAFKACTKDSHFYVKSKVNERYPDEIVDIDACYPIAEGLSDPRELD